jgi:hypothetical protein
MKIHWSLNGTEFPVAFELPPSLKHRAFFPTVTLKVCLSLSLSTLSSLFILFIRFKVDWFLFFLFLNRTQSCYWILEPHRSNIRLREVTKDLLKPTSHKRHWVELKSNSKGNKHTPLSNSYRHAKCV